MSTPPPRGAVRDETISLKFNPSAAVTPSVEPLEPRLLLSGVAFPADAEVINVATHVEGGVDLADNSHDDTAGIQAAFDAAGEGPGTILYFPDGTYNISDTLELPLDTDTGEVQRKIVWGQSVSGTILKLFDNDSDFNNASSPAAVLDFNGLDDSDSFRNGVRNLTLDVGSDNAGAIGINFVASNNGSIRDVVIESSDAQGDGFIALNTAFNNNGPFLVDGLVTDGFDYGVRIGGTNQNSMVFTDLTVDNFNVAGILQEQNQANPTSIFDLSSTGGAGPVIESFVDDPDPNFSIVDADVTAGSGASGDTAFRLGGQSYLRGITTTGYTNAITNNWDGTVTVTGNVTDYEFASYGDDGSPESGFNYTFSNQELSGLGLTLEMAPDVAWGDPATDWVNPFPSHEGAHEPTGDQTAVIQAAIDTSGAKTVYLPRGSYTIDGTLVVRGDVERIIGAEAQLDGEGSIVFADGTASNVIIEGIEGMPELIHDSSRNLILSFVGFSTYRNTADGAGKLYIESATGDQMVITGQTVIAHQLNAKIPGAVSERLNSEAYIINDGGTLVINGFKTESPRQGDDFTFIKTINGGQTEVLGGLNLLNDNQWQAGDAAYEVGEDASFGGVIKLTGIGAASLDNSVQHTRDGVTSTPIGGDRTYFLARGDAIETTSFMTATDVAPYGGDVALCQDAINTGIPTGNGGGRTQWRDNGSKHGDPGQIFVTTDAFTADSVTLLVENGGIDDNHEGRTWFMDILEIDGSNNIVANVSSTTGSAIDLDESAYLTFDITDTELTASTRYAFRFGFLGGVTGGITDFFGHNNSGNPWNIVTTNPGAGSSQGATTAFGGEETGRSFAFWIQQTTDSLSSSTSAPTQDVVISQTDGSDGVIDFGNGYRTQWRENVANGKHGDPGQVFETTERVIADEITLHLAGGGVNASHEDVQWFMDILKLDSSNNIVENVGSSIVDGVAAAGSEYLTFDIRDAVLEADTRYTFRWGILGGVTSGITDFVGDNDGVFGFDMVATTPGAGSSQGATTAFNASSNNNSFEFYISGQQDSAAATNAAPTAVTLSNEVNELFEFTNTDTRIKVADLSITDDGNGDNNLWVSGTGNQLFEADATGLYVRQDAVLEVGAYNVTVNVDDALAGAGVPDATASYTLTVTNDPTNLYTFDSNANDSGSDPTPNDGVLQGDAAIDTNHAKIGAGALSLDGSGDYVELDNADFKDGFEKYAIAFWFKADTVTGTQTLYEEGGAGTGVGIRLNGSTLEARFKDGTLIKDLSVTGVTANEWHFVALTFDEEDNGEIALYFNSSTASDTVAVGNPIGNHGNPAAIGATNGEDVFGTTSTGDYFDGLIDQFRIFDGENLTSDQVQDLLDEGSAEGG